MARQHNYRYEYKKQNYLQRPEYTTDIQLRIYVRYSETNVPHILDFTRIHEEYYCAESSYVIGDVSLAELLRKRGQLGGSDVFMANIPLFFQNN